MPIVLKAKVKKAKNNDDSTSNYYFCFYKRILCKLQKEPFGSQEKKDNNFLYSQQACQYLFKITYYI